MTAFSSYAILSLLILETLAMVFPLGLAQLTPEAQPPFSAHQNKQSVKFNPMHCMTAMATNIFSCAPDVFRFFVGWKGMTAPLGVSQTCCIALFEITQKCSFQRFPMESLVPQDVVELCAEPGAAAAPGPVSEALSPGI